MSSSRSRRSRSSRRSGGGGSRRGRSRRRNSERSLRRCKERLTDLARSLKRDVNRYAKRERQERVICKRAMVGGDGAGVERHALNCVRAAKQKELYIRTWAGVENTVASVESAMITRRLGREMGRTANALRTTSRHMRPEELARVMDKFESGATDIELISQIMSSTMADSASVAATVSSSSSSADVRRTIAEVGELYEIEPALYNDFIFDDVYECDASTASTVAASAASRRDNDDNNRFLYEENRVRASLRRHGDIHDDDDDDANNHNGNNNSSHFDALAAIQNAPSVKGLVPL